MISYFFLLPYVLIAMVLAFSIPGFNAQGRLTSRFSKIESLIISTGIGLILWAYQAIIFGYLNLRFLSYLYIALNLWYFVKRQIQAPTFSLRLKLRFGEISKNTVSLLFVCVFVAGVFGQSAPYWIGGNPLDDGYHLNRSTKDSLWHSALIAQIVRRFPPDEPGLSGYRFSNYHYWADIIIAEFSRVFHLPPLATQYHYIYPLMSLLLGSITYVLAKTFGFSKLGILLAVYLQYFHSDIIYFLTFLTTRVVRFDIWPISTGPTFFDTLSLSFSHAILMLAVLVLFFWIKTRENRAGIIVILLFSSLIGLKTHTGIIINLGLFSIALWFILNHRYRQFVFVLLSYMLSLSIFLLLNKPTVALVFSPFWFIRHEFATDTRLGLASLDSLRQLYLLNGAGIRSFLLDALMLIIFLAAFFGLNTLALVPSRLLKKSLGNLFFCFFYVSIFGGLLFGSLTSEKGGDIHVYNFFFAAIPLINLVTAHTYANFLTAYRSKFIHFMLVLFLLGTTLPRWIYSVSVIQNYFSPRAAVVSRDELEAMDFIRNNSTKKDVVLVDNNGHLDSVYPYVSTFTQRDMFLSGQQFLREDGVNYQKREQERNNLLSTSDPVVAREILKENNIKFLYFYGTPILSPGLLNAPITLSFQNSSVTVYQFE